MFSPPYTTSLPRKFQWLWRGLALVKGYRSFRERRQTIWVGVLIVLFFIGVHLRLWSDGLVDPIENFLVDVRLRSEIAFRSKPVGVDPRIVILDIDEKSLRDDYLGPWPWSRDKVAKLTTQLFQKYQVRLIAYDIFFPQKQPTLIQEILAKESHILIRPTPLVEEYLQRVANQFNPDKSLAKSLAEGKSVLSLVFTSDKGRLGILPPPATMGLCPAGVRQFSGYIANYRLLNDSAHLVGDTHVIPDEGGGVIRRAPLLTCHQGRLYQSLSLAIYRTLQEKPTDIELEYATFSDGYLPTLISVFPRALCPLDGFFCDTEWVSKLDVNPSSNVLVKEGERTLLSVPVDKELSTWVPFRGYGGPSIEEENNPRRNAIGNGFIYVSLGDIWKGEYPAIALKDKIVIVGTTAVGMQDLRNTYFNSAYPGVEIHANLLSAMLGGKDALSFKYRPFPALGIELVLIIVIGIIWLVRGQQLSVSRSVWLFAASLTVLTLYHLWAYWAQSWMLRVSPMFLMIFALFIWSIAAGYLSETRVKKAITGHFRRYVSPQLVTEITANPGGSDNFPPVRADLTILFSDIRGFTTISEQLREDELQEYINQYLTAMSRIIGHHHGTVDKFIGDAVMAFWGDPLKGGGEQEEQHALNAVRAALEMQKEAQRLSKVFQAQGWPPLDMGIGINTGIVRVGNMGSEERLAYTVIGDAVNIASRLEGRTKEYHVKILIGEDTYSHVYRSFGAGSAPLDELPICFRELDRIQVRGKNEPVLIHEVICFREERTMALDENLVLWKQCLNAYRSARWVEAHKRLHQLIEKHPESRGLYEMFLERVAAYIENPPSVSWDGVTHFTHK